MNEEHPIDDEQDLEFAKELFVAEQDIPFPDSDEWRNLGKTVRGQVAAEKQRSRVRLFALAAAACVALFAMVAVVSDSGDGVSASPDIAQSNTDEVIVKPDEAGPNRGQAPVLVAEKPMSDLETIEAISAMIELDMLTIDLGDSGIVESTELVDVLDGYDIDSAAILDDGLSSY